jgi:hypothetical protein
MDPNTDRISRAHTHTSRSHKEDAINAHFGDIPLPSAGNAVVRPRNTGTATFHTWIVEAESSSSSTSNLINFEPTDPTAEPPKSIISRVTVFDHAAQPMYPPYIFTRSDYSTLSANIGRIVPLFRQLPRTKNQFVSRGYHKIVTVEVISSQSDELKNFIEMKVRAGGLKKERTKEQWQDTFGTDWVKVTLRPVEIGISDPMGVPDIRAALEDLDSDRWM